MRAAVSSTERVTTAARPPSSGWANSTGALANRTPRAGRSKRRKNGEARASGCAAEQTSCQKPGSVSSSVRHPPPIVGAPSITRTFRPAADRVTAAARPFGPLPTITASGFPRMTPLLPVALGLSAGAAPARGLEYAAHRRVVPDVAGVTPLALRVYAGSGRVHLRIGYAEALPERGQRGRPELVFLGVAAHDHPGLVERVVRPHEHLSLDDGLVALFFRGEGDPAGEHVTLRGHQRERLVVGVQDEHTGRQLHAAAEGQVQEGDVARVDAGQRAGEPVALRPELGEVLLPDRDRVGGLDLGPRLHAVGLLPHLAEALHRAREAPASDVRPADAVAVVHLKPVHLAGPAGVVPRRGGFRLAGAQPDLLGRRHLVRTCCLSHGPPLT